MSTPTEVGLEALKRYGDVETEIGSVPPLHTIGALALKTKNLKLQLIYEVSQWKASPPAVSAMAAS